MTASGLRGSPTAKDEAPPRPHVASARGEATLSCERPQLLFGVGVGLGVGLAFGFA